MEHGHSPREPGQHGQERTHSPHTQVCAEEGDVRHQAEAPRPSPESVPSALNLTRGTASLTYWDCGRRFCYGHSPPGTRRKTAGSSREESGLAEFSAPQAVQALRVRLRNPHLGSGPGRTMRDMLLPFCVFFGCVGSSLLSVCFSPVVVCTLLMTVASLVVEHRL